MKPISRLIVCGLLLSGLLLPSQSRAFDAGPSLWLERYTLETNGDLVWDNGHLLSNGKFQMLTTEIVDPLYIDPNADFTPISGRPICIEEEYNAYKTTGIVPRWTRSRDDFQIGYLAYVIVSVVGGQDPNPAVTISAQPQSQSVLKGDPAYFYVFADPILYLSYQWCLNGKPIPGETNFDLWIGSAEPSQAGNYSVLINTGGRNVSSAKALLRVLLPVAITSEPRSQTIKAGRGAVFRVAVKGTGPFTYQWYWNGSPIPKATSSFFTIPKVHADQAGSFVIVVGNGVSYVQSNPATLAVTP